MSRRPGDDEASRRCSTVQLRLDRVQRFGDVLVLVDAHRRRARHEQPRIRTECLPYGQIIEIDHRDPVPLGRLAKQRRLPDRAGPVQREDWLLRKAREHHLAEATTHLSLQHHLQVLPQTSGTGGLLPRKLEGGCQGN